MSGGRNRPRCPLLEPVQALSPSKQTFVLRPCRPSCVGNKDREGSLAALFDHKPACIIIGRCDRKPRPHGSLAVNLRRRTPLFASRPVYVCKSLQVRVAAPPGHPPGRCREAAQLPLLDGLLQGEFVTAQHVDVIDQERREAFHILWLDRHAGGAAPRAPRTSLPCLSGVRTGFS
jgi:hypothetical protein